MAALIPGETLDAIRQRIDIVDIVGEYVALKRQGKNHVGLCPFHSEKTPSFSVSQEKQLYYCFGCGAGGSVFNFLVEIEGITFPEAVASLAPKAGIDLPQGDEDNSQRRERLNLQKSLFLINDQAQEFFHSVLTAFGAGREGAEYLEKRGVNAQTVENFQLGFAPERWNGLVNYFSRREIPGERLVAAGLALERKKGSGHYDRFRSRVMFPIHDEQNRVIGFGGRIIGQGEPKYLNSPETVIFQKGSILFGLDKARESIRRENQAVIMEGYMDVVTAHQHGITTAVASLGTSLTEAQARLLKRFVNNVVIAYDADAAGEAATLRGLDILRDQGLKVRVLTLPAGSDPDDFIRDHGRQPFLGLIKASLPLINYKLELFLGKAARGIDGRIEVANKLLPDLRRLGNEIERGEYLKIIAERLNLNEAFIQAELTKKGAVLQKNGTAQDKKEKLRHNSKRAIVSVPSAYLKAQHIILKAMMISEKMFEIVQEKLTLANFSMAEGEAARAIVASRRLKPQVAIDAADLLDCMETPEARQLVAGLSIDELLVDEQILTDSLGAVLAHGLQHQLKDLRAQLVEAESIKASDTVKKLIVKISDLQAELWKLSSQ